MLYFCAGSILWHFSFQTSQFCKRGTFSQEVLQSLGCGALQDNALSGIASNVVDTVGETRHMYTAPISVTATHLLCSFFIYTVHPVYQVHVSDVELDFAVCLVKLDWLPLSCIALIRPSQLSYQGSSAGRASTLLAVWVQIPPEQLFFIRKRYVKISCISLL